MTPGERDVLLVVDVQNDFIPGGALAVAQGDEVVPIINRLARALRHVVLTQDWHPPGHVSFASTHFSREPLPRARPRTCAAARLNARAPAPAA